MSNFLAISPLLATATARISPLQVVRMMLDSCTPNTRRCYAQSLRAFGQFAGVDDYEAAAAEWLVQPETIRNRLVQAFIDSMRGAGIRPSTTQTRIAALRRLAETAGFYGVASGRVQINQLPAVENRLDGKDAELGAIRGLRAEIQGHEHASRRLRDTALLAMMFPVGARIGGETEGRRTGILGMNRDDVDFERGTVRLFLKGKTDPWEIRPDTETVNQLRAWASFRDACIGDTGPLFVGIDRHGGLARTRLLQQTIRAWLQRVGKPSPHSFRHAVATTMLRRAGASLADVRDQLGHSSLRTAERYVSYKDRSAGVGEGLRNVAIAGRRIVV